MLSAWSLKAQLAAHACVPLRCTAPGPPSAPRSNRGRRVGEPTPPTLTHLGPRPTGTCVPRVRRFLASLLATCLSKSKLINASPADNNLSNGVLRLLLAACAGAFSLARFADRLSPRPPTLPCPWPPAPRALLRPLARAMQGRVRRYKKIKAVDPFSKTHGVVDTTGGKVYDLAPRASEAEHIPSKLRAMMRRAEQRKPGAPGASWQARPQAARPQQSGGAPKKVKPGAGGGPSPAATASSAASAAPPAEKAHQNFQVRGLVGWAGVGSAQHRMHLQRTRRPHH
jgi:hypothetical protein